MKRILFALFLSFLPAAPQQLPDPDSPLIRISVNLVQIDAVVTDKSGRPVTDLTAADFELLQDGKPRPITHFAYIPLQSPGTRPQPAAPGAPPPPVALRPEQVRRSIVLVVDDLAMDLNSLQYIRQGIRKFIPALEPGDQVALMRTSSAAGAFQPFTTDRARIEQFADSLRTHFRTRSTPGGNAPGGGFTSGGEVAVRNQGAALSAIGALQWVVDGLGPVPGRKSVIYLSEGFRLNTRSIGMDMTNGVLASPLRRLVEKATRAGVVLYTIDPHGLAPLGPTASDDIRNTVQATRTLERRMNELADTQMSLRTLATETGGRFYLDNNSLDNSLRRALDDQAGFYLLGYDPPGETFDRKYHKVSVRVKKSGLEVRSRVGFVGVEDQPAPAVSTLTPQQHLARALQSPFQPSAIPVRLTGLFALDEHEKPTLHCLVHIGIAGLPFSTGADGKLHAELDLVLAGFDVHGDTAFQSAQPVGISIDPAKKDEAFQKGIFVVTAYPLKAAGAYQLRTAVRERSQGIIGTSNQFLLAPDLSKGNPELSSLVLVSGTDPADRMRPATRQFRPGETVEFSAQVLNTKPGAKLTAQVRLFENGEELFQSAPAPVPDQQAARGAIRLNRQISPGNYALQLTVTGTSGSRPVQLSQWTDLHIRN